MAKNKLNKKICFVLDSPIDDLSGASLRLYYEYINYFLKFNKVLVIYFDFDIKKKKWPTKITPKNLEIIKLKKKTHLVPNKFSLINKSLFVVFLRYQTNNTFNNTDKTKPTVRPTCKLFITTPFNFVFHLF